MKKHILIVEDEAILYNRMKKSLEKNNFSVDQYTPSVKEAILNINNKRPDLVLLDIKLQGEQTGIDLGKKLHEDYNIPFIYVTELDDDYTFYKGLNTNHEFFMVKTKPRLQINELLRTIYTVLNKNEVKNTKSVKGVLGLVDYLDRIKELGHKTITRTPVKYEDIVFFTVKPIEKKGNKYKIQKNYLWFLTKDNKSYFMRKSLKELQQELPDFFVRINESYIVNISEDIFDGRINGSKICVLNRYLVITDTYRKEVNKRIEQFYLTN